MPTRDNTNAKSSKNAVKGASTDLKRPKGDSKKPAKQPDKPQSRPTSRPSSGSKSETATAKPKKPLKTASLKGSTGKASKPSTGGSQKAESGKRKAVESQTTRATPDAATTKPATVATSKAILPYDPYQVEAADYEAKKIRENNKQRQFSADKREIGAIPACANPARRDACKEDFGLFLKTYFPEDTRHPWSKVHLKLIETIQIVVLVGAMLAMGIPRGWGKTFISVRAIIWAVAFRHHTMVMLIAASDPAAKDLLQDIRDEFETNELLQEDFPEICLPIAALEGINQRAKGQTSGGEPTRVKASDFELHLGDVKGQPGAVIYAGGITGSKIRGRRKKRGDKIERPTLGLIDDFQTRQSARSRLQCQTRLNIVSDDIPGLPGNDQSWACLLTCTVIEPNDAADQLLNREQHPDWRGIRASFLDSLPTDDALDYWDEWNRIRCEDLQTFDENEEDIEAEAISERAHDYYRKNRKAMQAGASVAWAYAFKPEHYVDALEKAMHWYFRSRRGFWSELQNQPDKFEVAAMPQLLPHLLMGRVHHCQQHMVPEDAEFLTAFADYSKAVLWYEVRAWATISTSWTIDYGTWPQQGKAYYTQATAQHTIDKLYAKLPTHSVRIMAAIRDLFTELFARPFQREDGSTIRLNIAGIDANDETDAIRDAIKKAGLSGKLWPMHSHSFRHPKTPINDLPVKDGDVVGDNWRRRKPHDGTSSLRYITFDTDHWKSHHRNRLMMDESAPGSITWFRGSDHRMIADHHAAEVSDIITVDATGQKYEVWSQKPGVDNHLWDVGIGNDVLGSVLGCRLPSSMILTNSNQMPQLRRRKKKKTRVVL